MHGESTTEGGQQNLPTRSLTKATITRRRLLKMTIAIPIMAADGAQQPISIFKTQTPALVNQSDGPSATYELGLKFQSSVTGKITGIRFWKGSAEQTRHVGRIWSASGTLLASVTFANETASGWQVQNPATPLSINANTTYGHLEKFFSPSRCESDSLIAMGHGRMERASHGADGLFRC